MRFAIGLWEQLGEGGHVFGIMLMGLVNFKKMADTPSATTLWEFWPTSILEIPHSSSSRWRNEFSRWTQF